jgi:hypothetical protein
MADQPARRVELAGSTAAAVAVSTEVVEATPAVGTGNCSRYSKREMERLAAKAASRFCFGRGSTG